MKTLHDNGTTQNRDFTRGRVRLFMTLAGIVTAIICLMALYNEKPTMPQKHVVHQLIETSKIAVADFSVEIASKAVVSLTPPF